MEDYKKKYEQALKRAKEQSSKYGIDKVILEEVFPELKESKDEKIRKQLLNWFKCCNWNAIDNETLKRDDIISWLEKQGNQKPVNKVEPEPYFYCKYGGTTPLCSDCKRNHINSPFKTEEITTWYIPTKGTKQCTDYIACLEKQVESQSIEGTFVNVDDVREYFMNEVYRIFDADSTNDRANQIIQTFDSLPTVVIKKSQDKSALDVWKGMRLEVYQQASGNRHEPNYSDDSTKMFSLIDIDEIFEKVAEKQDEQNLNEVKPKFEVGDWVVPNNGEPRVFRVEERGWPDSIISSSLGNQYVNTFTLNKQYHLWTIQDAKDGDVLVTKDRPFLFKGFADECSEHPVAYCGIDTTNAFYIPTSNSHWTYNICLLATKEQRDLLFTKMKEAGYEWDAEKKELKKIEQKSDENIEPKFKVGDKIYEKDIYEFGYGTIKEIRDGKYIFEDNSYIFVKQQELWEVVKEPCKRR